MHRHNRFYIKFLTLFLFLSKVSTISASDKPSNDTILSLFSSNKDASNAKLNLHGANIKDDEFLGRSLNLPNKSYATIDPPSNLSSKSGTISFWVNPQWQSSNSQSHTLLSMRWNDSRHSYMAISQGWWEPLGEKHLFFILSNQDTIHCSAPYVLPANEWSSVTVTWEYSSNKAHIKLFVDADKIAEGEGTGNYFLKPIGPLFIGSDKGATDQRNRSSEFFIGNLLIYDRPLTEQEIRFKYDSLANKISQQKSRWLKDEIKKDWVKTRDGSGRLLENRIIFDEDMHWALSRDNADRILDRVKKAGFNVYIPCVWHGGGSFFPSKIGSLDPRLRGVVKSGHDPLRYLISRAHEMGIEIHPWFTVIRRETNLYPEFYDDGTPPDAFNVHNPKFRTFIVNLMSDMVERYDVDGVNLDYIRAMGICTSSYCKKDYYLKLKHDFDDDFARRSVEGVARDRLQRWQDNAVLDIVRTFSERAREIKPGIVISVDGHPTSAVEPRPLEGRNEIYWANQGLISVIFNMDYAKRINPESIDEKIHLLENKTRFVEIFGNYDTVNGTAISRKGELIADLAAFAQRKWTKHGVAFYIYNMMDDEQIHALRSGPFQESAVTNWR